MKIAFDARLLSQPNFGLPRFLRDLLGGLDSRAEFSLELLSSVQPTGDLPARAAVRLIRPFSPRFFPLWEHVSLPMHLDRYDVYHAPNNLGLPLFPTRVPTVLTLHDIIPFFVPGVLSGAKYRYFTASVRISLDRATVVVFDSAAVRDQIVDIFPTVAAKSRVVHLGIDPARPTAEAVRIVEKNGLDKMRYAVYAAGYRSYKDPDTLITAFREVCAKNKNAGLVMAGHVPKGLRNRIECEISPGRIVMPGMVTDDELRALYMHSSCVVSTSHMEGFNYSPLEGMMQGAAAIAADIPVNREILGDRAQFFKAGDADALTSLLKDPLGSEPTDSECLARRQWVEENYSFDRMAEAYASVYRAVSRG